MVVEYNSFQQKWLLLHSIKLLSLYSWCPPQLGCVKVICNSQILNNKYRGLGVVIRDDQGTLLVSGVHRNNAN